MVIFISGSINSGKTTISNLLKKQIPNTSHIEIDDLRSFIGWMPLEQSIPINLENAASIINNFTRKNINCIVSYPINKNEYDLIISKLEKPKRIYFFTLAPVLEIALSKRGERVLTEKETERIKYHYLTGINHPGFGVIIDNSNQTAEETTDEILKYIKIKS
ncbi:MAG TPA: hypothetical protein VGK25_05490 [Ignavibacteria bacterium]